MPPAAGRNFFSPRGGTISARRRMDSCEPAARPAPHAPGEPSGDVPMSKKDAAKGIIAAFAARTAGPQAWRTLDRAQVAAGAIDRIDDPDKIKQQESSMCGPACLAHAVATDAPQDYAQAIVDLF